MDTVRDFLSSLDNMDWRFWVVIVSLIVAIVTPTVVSRIKEYKEKK